jgi:hypothetical protein
MPPRTGRATELAVPEAWTAGAGAGTDTDTDTDTDTVKIGGRLATGVLAIGTHSPPIP